MKSFAPIMLFLLCGILIFNTSAIGQPPPPPRGDRPPRPDRPPGPGQQYSIEQAISDRAQLTTIAVSGLAFLTGTFGCDTFLPPGKVCDYFGFQYMRDVQPKGKGHNTDFLTRIADNMLYMLTDSQRSQLIALAKEQERQMRDLAYKRFPLIQAFRRQLAGDIPPGCAGLNKTAVMRTTSEIFILDGQLAYERAVVYGKILSTLSNEQKSYLSKMKFDDHTTWPEMGEILDKRSMPHDMHVLVMTYASDLFSWHAGSVEADTYFCPERHGTYFGGFYLKDAPAMGQRNYTISNRLTGDSGKQFLDILTPGQSERIAAIVDLQRADLQKIVDLRRNLSTELRKSLNQGKADKAQILALAKRYGELDGELSYYYAASFAEVGKTLKIEQKAALVKLRNLDLTPRGAFVYSEPIDMPKIPNTDFLFTNAGSH